MSVNLELPTAEGLKKLAPHKSRTTILRPMKQIQNRREENRQELVLYRHAPEFVPAGQSAQMIVGAAGESGLPDRLCGRGAVQAVFSEACILFCFCICE